MSQQNIDIGIQGNDGTGDSIRESFRKVNNNFTELYAVFGAGGTIPFTRLADAPLGGYAANQVIMGNTTGSALSARTLVAGTGIIINKSTNSTLTISSSTTGVAGDTLPTLSASLNANNFTIGRLADPSTALVTAFNALYPGTPTTLNQLAVTLGYANSHYIQVTNGYLTAALKVRAQPVLPQTSDPDYDATLTGNYVSTEAMQRKDVVYRGGDTMSGALTLSDHPTPLSGVGVINNSSDLQAATKYYVDNNTFYSGVNLFVSATKGDDTQKNTPVGREGRYWQYAYKTVGAAALQASNLINLSGLEPGPYKQRISYTQAPNQFFSTIQTVTLSGGNSGDAGYTSAATLLESNKPFIQAETIAYLNKKYVNDFNFSKTRYATLIQNIINGVGYDLTVGSNFNSVTQVSTLFNSQNTDIINYQLSQIIDAVNYARTQILAFSYSTVNAQTYIGKVIDALCYDLVFGSNYQSITVALGFPYAETNLSNNEMASVVSNLATTILSYTSVTVSSTAVGSITKNSALISNILQGSTTYTPSWPALLSTTIGKTSARDLLVNNIGFMQAEIISYITANYPSLNYSKTTCQRDVKYIVQSLIYDIMYGGNSQSTYAGLQYWAYNKLEIAVYEKTATLAAIGYLGTLVTAVVTNTAPALIYQNSVIQYFNSTFSGNNTATATFYSGSTSSTSLTVTTGAVAISVGQVLTGTGFVSGQTVLTAAVSDIYTVITLSAVPTVQPAGVITFTSPVLGVISTNITLIQNILGQSSKPTPSVTQPDISKGSSVLQTAFTYIENQKVSSLEPAGVTYINANYPVINDSGVNTSVGILFDYITNTLTNGIAARPTITYTDPTGLSIVYTHARQAMLANLTFLAEETYAYTLSNYPTFIPAYGIATFKTNMKALVEAVCYDITYGGNSASLYAANRFYNDGASILDNTEKTITGYAITHLQNIAVIVAGNGNVNPTFSAVSQVKSGVWADGGGASASINSLFTSIYGIVTANTSYVLINPTLTGYSSTLRAAQTIISDNAVTISNSVNSYLTKTYTGGFNYNQATCYRDIGLIVDAMALDLLTAGTYQSINAGLSYYSNTSAKAVAIGTQYTETLDGLQFAQSLGLQVLNQTTAQRFQTLVGQIFNVALIPSSGAKTTYTNNYNLMLSIVTTGLGAAPTITTATFGTGIYTITISNGGNGYVDQGAPGDTHIIPAKILVGANSGANGSIITYTPGSGSGVDTIVVRMLKPGFFVPGEQMDFAETVKVLNITIRVESGIYYEDYPIKLPANCSISGDEFRRTIMRPLDRVSQSPWRNVFFYRDAVVDALQIGLINFSTDNATATTLSISATTVTLVATLGSGQALAAWIGMVLTDATSETGTAGKAVVTSVSGNVLNCTVIYPFAAVTTYASGSWHLYNTINYGRHYLTNPLDVTSAPKNNKLIDVLLCNDATRVTGITFQGHGGFAMVLDPEGQIKTKSPYGQVCTSFSQSINAKRFAGGQFVDGFAGRLFGSITNIQNSSAGVPGIIVTVTGSANSGLDIRAPQAPCVFYIAGNRFQVDDVPSFDASTYTATLILDTSTPFNPANIYNSTNYSATVGSILDAVTYDLVFGGNYQTIKAALTYLNSANYVAGLQQLYAIAGLNKARDLTNATISTGTSKTIITNSIATITLALVNGVAVIPTATFPNPPGVSTNVSNAKAILLANKVFIQNEIAAWVASNYSVKAIPNYSAVTLSTRIGYATDAIIYDLLYGGNSSTYDTALSYYLGGNQITGQETYYAAAFGRLNTIVQQIVVNQTVTISAGNLQTQNTGLSTASVTEATTLGNLISIIVDYVADGVFTTPTTRTVPTLPNTTTYPSYTQVSADRTTIQSAKTAIQLSVNNFLNAGAGLPINIEMGGNRSMLANDFAMINDLSYAIIATNGGVTEQVSTFTYYCHTHFWSNNGGQIRSVGSSNAHGDYGLRASGYDVTELPDSVNLANDMMQTAYVYKQGSISSQMTPTGTVQALAVWITGWEYVPQGNSEMEIDHTLQGGLVTRYLVSTVEHTAITVNGQNILKLNLSTAGLNSTATTGLAYTLYDGQTLILRVTQNIKFNNIDNVKPTRPSTAVQYADNLSDIYRVIAYNLTDSTGEALAANVAVLQADSTFNYYKFVTDGANLTQVDPGDATKTQGSKVGDNKIAVLQISLSTTINQINKGIYLTAWAGRVHRVIGYTVPTFIATGTYSAYTAVSTTYTLTVTSVAGTLVANTAVSGTGIAPGTTVVSFTTSGTSSITAVVVLSAPATSPSGTITFGVAKNGYLTIDPNPIYNSAADGTSVTAMSYASKTDGPTGTTYKLVTFNIPFTNRLPVVDSYITVQGQSNTSYNGSYQISAVGNSTTISVSSVTGLAVDMIVTTLAAGAYVPASCIIQSINTVANTFTVAPAAWVPSGATLSATAVATLSSITITNSGSGYSSAPIITISGGGALNQALAICTIVGGSIATVTVISPGYGYTSTPDVKINGVLIDTGHNSAQLTAVLTASPTYSVTTTAGAITTSLKLVYPTDPGSFTTGAITGTLTGYTSKTGTGPYLVTFTSSLSAIPPASTWFLVSGNTNPLYNGYYQVSGIVSTLATATTVSTDGTRPNQITVSSTVGMTANTPIQFTSASTAAVTLTATTATGNYLTVSNSSLLSVGESLVFTAVTQSSTLTATSSTGNLLTLASVSGLTVNEPIVFTSVTQTPTLKITNPTGNLLTLSDTTGIAVGSSIVFTAVTQTSYASAATASTDGTRPNQITMGSTSGLVVGEPITFTQAATSTPTITATTTGTNLVTLNSTLNLNQGESIIPTAVSQSTTMSATTNATFTTTGSSISGTTYTVGTQSSGTVVAGAVLSGGTIPAGTYIVSNISGSGNGSTWLVSASVSQGSTTISGTVNLLTVGATTGMVVGEPILTGATGAGSSGVGTTTTYYITKVITASNQIGVATVYGATSDLTVVTSAANTLSITAGSTLGGLTSGSTYYIASIAGSQVTLSSSPTLSPVVSLTSANGAWTTLAGSVLGGITSGTTYYVATIPDSTHITVSNTAGSVTPITLNTGVAGFSGTGWTSSAGNTLGGIQSGNTYYVLTIPTPGVNGTVTVSTSPGGGAQPVTTSAGTWTSVAGSIFGGLTSGTTYWVAAINSGSSTIQVSSAYGGGALSLTNGGGAWTSLAGNSFGGLSASTPYYVLTNNTGTNKITVSTVPSGTVQTVSDSGGTWTSVDGTILGNLVSGNTYYIKSVVDSTHITVSASAPGGTAGAVFALVTATIAAAVNSGSTTGITLSYTYDPGTYSSSTTTSIVSEGTNAYSSTLGIGRPFSTTTSTTLRMGYAAGEAGQITTRISTCRVTGHDFLYIGTGSYTTTNWPTVIYGNPAQSKVQSQEVLEESVGRVFYTSTDQDGVFRVGRFFTVDQGTGSVTFSASIALSNLDGLGFKRGVVVSEFSTDASMTNNASDTVSVQSAVRGFVDKRLGLDYGGAPIATNSLIGPGFLALNGVLPMKAPLNMAQFAIRNVGTPTIGTDAVTKDYADTLSTAFNAISKLTDVTITSAGNGNTLVYNGTSGKWNNVGLPTGDVNISYSSVSGTLTTAIQAGVIINSQVSTSAAIAQSKLAMQAANASLTSAPGSLVQSNLGIATFNGNAFVVTNGWVDHITASSTTTGVLLTKIQYVASGTILGNRTNSAASPTAITPVQVVSDGNAISNAPFTTPGVLTLSTYADSIINGVTNTGGGNTYSITSISSTHGVNSLIKSASDASVDVGSLKVQGNTAVSTNTITNTLSLVTPGSFTFLTAVGTAGSNTAITTFGTLDTTNGTLKANLLTTGAPASAGAVVGTWSVGASSTWDVTAGTLKSATLTTGSDSNSGTIQGTWTLTGASKMQATYADLAEWYTSDQEYEPGTVLIFGGDAETTTTNIFGDTRMAGVVTTAPAYVMNSELKGQRVCLALAGRVPCRVVGRVKKGDLLTTSAIPGHAVKATDPKLGSIIGKAIEDKDYDSAGTIEVAVGRA
jgi:hypothetical protein